MNFNPNSPTIIDLVGKPNWSSNQKSSGKVLEILDPADIRKITFIYAISNATPDVWSRIVKNALSGSADFIPDDRAPKEFWLKALIETKNGSHFLIQLTSAQALLTSESFHGYFKIAK
jgi:hypothetical protein